MASPIISIIVPVYNVEKYLCKCLDSIIAQTFTDFEAVLVDDGSADNSGRICDEYAAKDSRFMVVHKQNEGVAKARITAFEHSKGELISFIDSDDYVLPEYLEKLSKPILEEGIDLVSCDFYIVKDHKINTYAAKKTGRFDKQSISVFIAHHYFYDKECEGFGMTQFLWTKMIKREFAEKSLYRGQGIWIGEDQVVLLKIISDISNMLLIPDRLYYYVQHSGQATCKYDWSIWMSINRMLEGYGEILEKTPIAKDGIRIRTWIILRNTIYNKMIASAIDKNTFIAHLKKARNLNYIKEFFLAYNIPLGLKDKIKYWMLKLKCFRLFYYITR